MKVACQDAMCVNPAPGRLEFLSCDPMVAGASCSFDGNNTVTFTYASSVSLPFGSTIPVGSISVRALSAGSEVIWQRGDTIGPGSGVEPEFAVLTQGSNPTYANASGTREVRLNADPVVEIIKQVSCDGGASWVKDCTAPQLSRCVYATW